MKKKEYYKDILEYIEARLELIEALNNASTTKDFYKQQLQFHIVEQRQKEINDWLESEIEGEDNENR